jgi:hypothetical protein
MKCPKCGLDNIHGAMYCEDCGTLLKGKDPSMVSAPPPPPARARVPQYAPPPPPPPPQSWEHQYNPPPAALNRFAPPTVPVRLPANLCPKCGRENVQSAVYCGGCGISLTGTGGIPNSPKCYGKLVPLGGGNEFFLDREKMLIGRRSEAEGIYPEIDLSLLDVSTGVSRRHAQILKDETHVLVEDLGSSNGTFVNDTKLSEGVQNPVKDGDNVRFGSFGFIYRALK